LLFQRTERQDGRATRSIEVRFAGDHVAFTTEDNGQKVTKTEPIPPGVVYSGSDQLRLLQDGFHVGATDTLFILGHGLVQVQVVGRDRVQSGKRTIDAYVVQAGG